MKCDEVQTAISMYVDNALPGNRQGEMFAHLSTCRECRRFLQGVLELRTRLAALPAPEVPPALDRRVLSIRLARAPKAHGTRIRVAELWDRRLSVPLPSAALVAIALITVTVLSLSLLLRPGEVAIPCLPAVDVYLEQPTSPTHIQ